MELPRMLRREYENARQTHYRNTFYTKTAKPHSVTSTLATFQVGHCCISVMVDFVLLLGVRHALWLFGTW